MRTPPAILGVLLVVALAGASAAQDRETASAAQERHTRAVLATRYLPQVVDPTSPIAGFIDRSLPPRRRASVHDPERSLLARLVQLRLRGLSGPAPADPRRRVGIGDVALKLPIGDTLDLRPGFRVDYGLNPNEDLWTGDPTPTLGLGMRF